MTGRPAVLFPLFAGVETLTGIGEKTARAMEQLGIARPRDMVLTLPHGVIDRRPVRSIREIVPPAVASVEVEV